MNTIKLIKSSLVTVGLLATILPSAAFAVSTDPFAAGAKQLDSVAGAAGVQKSDLPTTIGKLINVGLTFLGIIFLVLILYAGFLWMTAGGEPEAVDKAKALLSQAVIGLIIIVTAYSLSSFVITKLGEATAA